MFTKPVVKALSIVTIILSCIGLLISIAGVFLIDKGGAITIAFFLGIVEWALLLWASIIAWQLSAKYNLYDELYTKIGIRVCIIIVAFVLFFFVGLVVGLIISVGIFATLWALKSNFDDWDNSVPGAPEEEEVIK